MLDAGIPTDAPVNAHYFECPHCGTDIAEHPGHKCRPLLADLIANSASEMLTQPARHSPAVFDIAAWPDHGRYTDGMGGPLSRADAMRRAGVPEYVIEHVTMSAVPDDLKAAEIPAPKPNGPYEVWYQARATTPRMTDGNGPHSTRHDSVREAIARRDNLIYRGVYRAWVTCYGNIVPGSEVHQWQMRPFQFVSRFRKMDKWQRLSWGANMRAKQRVNLWHRRRAETDIVSPLIQGYLGC